MTTQSEIENEAKKSFNESVKSSQQILEDVEKYLESLIDSRNYIAVLTIMALFTRDVKEPLLKVLKNKKLL